MSKESIKIILYQQHPGSRISDHDKEIITANRPDFVCLPEYFFVRSKNSDHLAEANYARENVDEIQRLSIELETCLIGGSIVEKVGKKYFNTCYVFERGKFIGSYSKIHLFHGEVRQGMSSGEKHQAFQCNGIRVGLLICADVMYEDSFIEMRKFDCDIVFVPTTSPLRDESAEEKMLRDEQIFVRGARVSGSYVAKCCAVGTIFTAPLQARSLIAAPDKIVQRIPFADEDKPMIMQETLSVDWIRNFKKKEPTGK